MSSAFIKKKLIQLIKEKWHKLDALDKREILLRMRMLTSKDLTEELNRLSIPRLRRMDNLINKYLTNLI